jgi:triacylglycerol esterase/lipase EstA (alpha/beta hydrolase family)
LSALAAGAALTLTAVAVPAQAAQLPLGNEAVAFVNSANPLFYHASPLGANVPCHPSAAHPYPVVLVEGTFASMYNSFQAISPDLVNNGYCVYAFNYGQTIPGSGFFAMGDIPASAGQLATEVNRVLASTGASKVDLVGWSQGGMMPRYYIEFLNGAAKVHTLVGLAPSNHGTTLDGLTALAAQYPGALSLLGASCPACTEQTQGSAFIQKLNAGGDTVPGVDYTVISSRYDEVVTPYQSQFLNGPNVHNVLLQDLCGIDLSEHVAIGTLDKIALHEAVNALDPANASQTTCLSVLS